MGRSARISILGLLLLIAALLAVPAQDQQSREPLTEGGIIRLLQGGVPSERVESLARDRGLVFGMTPAVERDLRDAGATEALLQALHEIASKAAPPKSQPAAPASTLLVVQTQPGEAQVYVDDVFSGKTSSEGVLKIPNLAPGEHHLRVTLEGYNDFEQRLEVAAGETTRYAAMLATFPPAPATPPEGGIVHFVLDRTLKTPSRAIRGVAFSGDSATLAALGEDGNVRLWRVATGELLKTIPLADQPKWVYCLAYSPDGKWLAVGEGFTKAKIYTGKVELLDAIAGLEVRALTVHHWGVNGVAFSRDGHWLVSGNHDKKVRVLEFPAGTEVRDFEGQSKPVYGVAISPDAQMIASGSWDATVALWDRASGKRLRLLTGHTGGIWSVDFSPDGRHLASASADGSVRIWNVSTGESSHTLSGHAGAVMSVAFSPDGKVLASGGTDDTVRLWDAATGQSLETLGAHAGVWQVAFSSDDRYLAAGYANGTVNLWKKQD
jgi:WD40 repeat protein